RQNHAAQAEAALRGLLVDEGLLNRMRSLDRAEAFERRDLRVGDRADGRHARSHGSPLDDDRARPALAESAAELRAAESEVVAEDVKKRSCWIDIDRLRL